MEGSLRKGIVLRSYAPYRQKVALFDSMLGRVDAVWRSPFVSRMLLQGALICYRLEKWRNSYQICDIELLALPHDWARTDINFLHHLLEMAFFFLPESGCFQLFQVCMRLYEDCELVGEQQQLYKKIMMARFFALLGICPEQTGNNTNERHDMVRHDIKLLGALISPAADGMPEAPESLDAINLRLRAWLLGCIQTHPDADKFTTVGFIQVL